MGSTESLPDPEFALLADLIAAAAASNTRRTLVLRGGQALLRHLPVLCFELGWCESESSTAATVVFEGGRHVTEGRRDLRGTELSRILKSGNADVEASNAGRAHLVIPLLDPDGGEGYARISLPSTWELAIAPPALAMVGAILSFARRHCMLVERIARLTSAAHQESRELRQELLRYTQPEDLVAKSRAMRRVIESAELVAGHDTTVLLRGESGTGKELLAKRIHRLSRRSRQPFVAVNCGALPETLIESELFGHEKGAFTGAVSRHRGRFERANHGTIFLDEVAELPPPVQVKLLRVLQEGEFERVGGEETLRVDVRVLAATNQLLEAMIERGTFRADLFYRISVFPILIPPLRERKEDTPLLARTLLAAISRRLGCPAPALSLDTIRKLVEYRWPGNVRELANTLERALIVSQGKTLDIRDLGTAAKSASGNAGPETFDQGARRTIENALEASGGRIYGKQGAAALLGIPPSTLQGKMRRLQMNRRRSSVKHGE
jgi:transcriptional regulator with GAF, ATPase, and Fis domain